MSLHYYCGKAGTATEFNEDEWYTLIGNALRMEDIVDRHYSITKGYQMENKLGKLVVDEWGCWHPDGSGPTKGYNLFEQQSTMRDAVISALRLNIFNNNCDKVLMANAAQVCNNLHCLLLAGDGYLVKTPTYHVFDMMKGHQGGTALRTVVSDNSDLKNGVSASATVKDGVMTVTLANLSCENDAEVMLDLLGLEGVPSEIKATLLTSADMKDHNTPEEPEKVVPLEMAVDFGKTVVLPKASVAVIEIKLN
jgi:alpha-N-arabinofuranosidase